MIPRCEGCVTELEMAIEAQDKEGLHYATTKKYVGIGERKHFALLMVDDKGRVVWH